MNIQLTISILISDRMETLGRCLSSLKPLLRELDSELIAVFTGKNEETLELIQQYAAVVVPFAWCNDFAKARNAGLEHAKGEWFLYLDDDEWFDNTEELIQFFKSGEYRHYQSAFYQVRNYLDWGFKNYTDGSVARMCRRTEQTHFIFPIHEYLDPFVEPQKNFRFFVHHVGYINQTESIQQEPTKGDRNIPLLLERLRKADGVDSFHCCMQLAQEYKNLEDYRTAIEYCERGLKLASRQKRVYAPEIWMQTYLPSLVSLTEGFQKGLEKGERILTSPRTLEVAAAHIASTLSIFCYELKEYRKGIKYVRLFHQKVDHLQKHPEKAMLQKSGDVTFSVVEGRAVQTYINGLVFAAAADNHSLINTILGWIPWDDAVSLSPHYPNLEGWKAEYPGLNDVILEGFSALETENTYVNFQKALYAEKHKQIPEAETYWKICVRDCPDLLLIQAVEMAVRNHFLLNPLMESLTAEIWEKCVRVLAGQRPLEEADTVCGDVSALLEDYPLRASMLEQYILERKLSQGLLEHSELVKLLQRYCGNLTSAAKKIYRDEVLYGSEVYALPSKYRFAFLIEKVLGLIKDGRFAGCVPLLKEAFHISPGMVVVVGQLTRYLTEQMEAPPQAVSKEFELLGGQVKQAVTDLMEKRQWQDAYGVTGQLVTLLPDDLEVLRMKQLILREGV